MTRQEWITQAHERIKNHKKTIQIMHETSSREPWWGNVKHDAYCAELSIQFIEAGLKLMEINTEELWELVCEEVQDQLAEWGTTSKIDHASMYDPEEGRHTVQENVPLRELLNQQCGPLIDKLYKRLIETLKVGA